MSDLDNYLEANYGEPVSKEAPCCGATSPLDHDFECRFTGTQINLPEWADVVPDPRRTDTWTETPTDPADTRRIVHIGDDQHPARQLPDAAEMGETDENGEFTMHPERPQYLSRGLAPEAKQVATDLYGAAEADRLFPVPATRKVAYWMPSGAQVPFDAVIQLTVRVPIAREPLNDDERDLVFRSAVRKINDDVTNLDGTVGYTILRTEPAVSPTDCGCTACTWFRDGFGDNVHGRACSNTDGATRLCEHTGCTCLSAMTDGECEACWLWSK